MAAPGSHATLPKKYKTKGMDAMMDLAAALVIWSGFAAFGGAAMLWAKQEG